MTIGFAVATPPSNDVGTNIVFLQAIDLFKLEQKEPWFLKARVCPDYDYVTISKLYVLASR